MLGIVDYGAGNQTSVARALKSRGIAHVITDSPARLSECAGIIFPGVGAAPQAMERLGRTGLGEFLAQAARNGQPLLGICVGCQIMLEQSEEGPCACLGIVPGQTLRFPSDMREEDGSAAQVPHMGWNSVKKIRPTRLLAGIADNAEFYFVHSYYPEPEEELVLATTFYGREFCSLYGRDGLWAAQFHPEKSGAAGLALLANFNSWCEEKQHALQTDHSLS